MEHLEQLIIDFKESLEREIREVNETVKTRFDTQAARMDRQGALLQAGSRWSGRMNGWADKADVALEQRDREIADLRARVERLERNQPRP